MELNTILKNIECHVDTIENGLTLKKSYKEELQELDNLESNVMTVRYFGTSPKANYLLKRINHIKSWMTEEMRAN